MGKYRVISFDGGGIRGLVSTILLQRIAATPGLEHFLDSADLLAGTSTGGLLALGLAHGLDLQSVRALYEERGAQIFDDSWLDDLIDLGKWRGAEYKTAPLRRELTRILGNATLGDLKKHVLITTFDLDNGAQQASERTWKPKLFHNFEGPNTDRAALAVNVGLYTCAAPSYFPSVDGYVDGGVFANNPVMCALAQTQDARYQPTPSLDEVVILSIGTGTSLQYITGQANDWGYTQWAKPMVNLMLDGSMGIAHYQCEKILGNRYRRLAPTFPPGQGVQLDEVSKVKHMIDFASNTSAADRVKQQVDETVEWLKQVWLPD